MCENRRLANGGSASLRLTERDLRLLRDIFAHRLMSSVQILRLGYFSTQNRANRRLAKLAGVGLLLREPPVFQVSGQHSVFRLGLKAEPLLDEVGGLSSCELRKQLRRGPSRSLYEHTLRIVDVRCAFVRSVKLKVEIWLPELLCRHDYSERRGSAWNHCILKPDAFVRVFSEGKVLDAFIEVDLGNVSKPKLVAKLESYARYSDGVFQDTYGSDGFTLLFVTTGMLRLKWLSGLAKNTDCCIFGTTFRDLTFAGADATIWRSFDSAEPQQLSQIIGAEER